MPQTLTYKLLQAHLAEGELAPGGDITVSVDQILVEDATGTMTGMQFEMLDTRGGELSVAVPLAVMCVDHNVLQIDDKNMQDHWYLRSFSERYGLRFSPPGHGISHYIHLERGPAGWRTAGTSAPGRPPASRGTGSTTPVSHR